MIFPRMRNIADSNQRKILPSKDSAKDTFFQRFGKRYFSAKESPSSFLYIQYLNCTISKIHCKALQVLKAYIFPRQIKIYLDSTQILIYLNTRRIALERAPEGHRRRQRQWRTMPMVSDLVSQKKISRSEVECKWEAIFVVTLAQQYFWARASRQCITVEN